jgi:hypothetical protein
MTGNVTIFWLKTFVFFKLMIKPKSWKKGSSANIFLSGASSKCCITSKKCVFHKHSQYLGLLGFEKDDLNSLQSNLVWSYLPSLVPKAFFKNRAKNIPNHVEATTQHCLMLLLVLASIEMIKVKLCSFGGEPIFQRS